MTRAELEAAAEEKYPTGGYIWGMREAYIQGRLDQAEADARIAEEAATETGEGDAEWIAFEIRRGVE